MVLQMSHLACFVTCFVWYWILLCVILHLDFSIHLILTLFTTLAFTRLVHIVLQFALHVEVIFSNARYLLFCTHGCHLL